ncbi:MAG: hypothetical protein MUE96_04775 [Bacteroidia bacterium]|jgi:hypothetical protein|nr:hypothetical protein [Bacteroidia bacterium]
MKLVNRLYIITILATITGCGCYSTCDCFDENDASISIKLNTDTTTTNYWRQSDLIGVTLIEVDSAKNTQKAIDFIDDTGKASHFKGMALTIPNSKGLDSENEYVNPLVYKIEKDSIKLSVKISNIKTKGALSKSMCCKCYSNEYIEFSINGSLKRLSGVDGFGVSYTIVRP